MRNKTLTGIFLVAFLQVASSGLLAQENDAGLWTSVTIEKEVVKDLDLIVTEEVRFNENITEAGAILTDAGLEYKIWKGFRAGLFYRYTCRRRIDDSYSRLHRVYSDLAYKQKIRRFELGYRARFQVQYKDFSTSETGHVPEWYFRQKLSVSYNTKSRFDPYLGCELWYWIDPVWSRFDNLRLTAGVNVRITKIHSVDLGYLVNKEFNVVDPLTSWVVFAGYKVRL